MLKPIALSQPETVVVTVWIPCVYHRWWRQRYKFHFVFHANIVTRAERLSVCLSVCLSLCRRWRGTVFKAVANTLLCSVHYCFRLTVLSFSMYGLLMMVCTEKTTEQPESVADTGIPLEWDRASLCLWNTLGWVQMHFSGSTDDPKGPILNRKAKSQHYMLSVKSGGYVTEYRHWLGQS